VGRGRAGERGQDGSRPRFAAARGARRSRRRADHAGAIDRPALVPAAVLGLDEDGERTQTGAPIDALASPESLLILGSFEHVLER
jgi:hypothetical protein